MSKQLLNERTSEAPAVSVFIREKRVARTMTYAGTAARSLLLIAITIAFAMLGWRSAADVVAASGCGSSSATSC